MAFGAFQEGDLGLARVEGDTGVDHRVADFDDLSVQSSFYVVGAGGEGVRLTETGPYARRTVPEWLQGSSERGGALVTKAVLAPPPRTSVRAVRAAPSLAMRLRPRPERLRAARLAPRLRRCPRKASRLGGRLRNAPRP